MTTSAVSYLLRFASSFRGPVAGTLGVASDIRGAVEDLAGSVVWLKTFLHDAILGEEQRIIGRSGDQLEITGHGLASNAAVRVFASPGDSLPAPLAEGTIYYVRSIDADHIELSATSGPGAAVTLTSGISGDVWVSTVPDWINSIVLSNGTYGTGKLKDLVMWLAGTQTVTGAKTISTSGSLTIGGTGNVLLEARSLARVVRGPWIISDGSASQTVSFLAQAGEEWRTVLELPHGATLTTATVYVDPGAHAATPQFLPTLTLYKHNIATDTQTAIGAEPGVTDAPDDVTAYNASHSFAITGLSEVIDNATYIYRARFIQESGTDSAAGDVDGLILGFSVAKYDDGSS